MYTAFTFHIKNHKQKDKYTLTQRQSEWESCMHFLIQNFTCKNTNCVKPSFIKVCYCRFYTVFFVNFVSACMQATIFFAKEPNKISRFQSWMLVVRVDAVVFAVCWHDWCRELKPQFGRLFFYYSLVVGKMPLISFIHVESVCLFVCVWIRKYAMHWDY